MTSATSADYDEIASFFRSEVSDFSHRNVGDTFRCEDDISFFGPSQRQGSPVQSILVKSGRRSSNEKCNVRFVDLESSVVPTDRRLTQRPVIASDAPWLTVKRAFTHGYYWGCAEKRAVFWRSNTNYGLLLKPSLYSMLDSLEFVGIRSYPDKKSLDSPLLPGLTDEIRTRKQLVEVVLPADLPPYGEVPDTVSLEIRLAWLQGLAQTIGLYTAKCMTLSSWNRDALLSVQKVLKSLGLNSQFLEIDPTVVSTFNLAAVSFDDDEGNTETKARNNTGLQDETMVKKARVYRDFVPNEGWKKKRTTSKYILVLNPDEFNALQRMGFSATSLFVPVAKP